jgi:hypothetical protein
MDRETEVWIIGSIWTVTVLTIMIFGVGVLANEYKDGDVLEVVIMNATDGRMVAASCNVTISNNTGVISTNAMAGANGLYNWTITGLSVTPDGKYTAKANCSIGSNYWLAYQDFTLVDGRNQLKLNQITGRNVTQNYTGPSAADNAAEVWAAASRTLTQNMTENLTFPIAPTTAEIWAAASRTLTQNITQNITAEEITAAVWAGPSRTLTSFAFNVTLTQASIDAIADSVWAYANRSLTEFGSLVADIWGYATRELTGFGSLIADIWTEPSRTLTQNVTENLTFPVAPTEADIWGYATRTLTQNITQNVTSEVVAVTVQNITSTLNVTVTNTTFTVINSTVNVTAATIYDNSTFNVIIPASG